MSGFIAGKYKASPTAYPDGSDVQVAVDEYGNVKVALATLTGSALTRATATGTGASASLISADTSRKVVIVSSTAANSSAAVDPTGGTCALDVGIPLEGGDTIQITGKEAQSAMTFFAASGQKLTVYTGA